MVIPNLGAFIAWGLLTAIGIGIDNAVLRSFVSPMLTYLLPLLIAFAGGRMIYDYRGGVIAAVATVGVIISTDITMFIGAMILGPLSAWLLKKFDQAIETKIPVGFELLINNYSIGIIGAALAVFGFVFLGPAIASLTTLFAGGVNFLMVKGLLPFTAILIEPAKVMFLNNAIGQGILTPMGTTQLAEFGKSALFLLESNPGPGLGILLAYMFFGKGSSRTSAWGASLIHLVGGIHEIYFPFVLMNPVLILPLIIGGGVGTFMFGLLNVGLVGVASPGSIVSIMLMAYTGDRLRICLAIIIACLVTFICAIPLVRRNSGDDESLKEAADQMNQLKGKKSRISSVFEGSGESTDFDFATVKRVAYACDAGIGSSAMGATVLQKKFRAAGLEDVEVFHISVQNLPTDCQVIVTQELLLDRVKASQKDAYCIAVTDFLNAPQYDELIENVRKARGLT